jgi:hypothetical protein
MCGIKRLLRSLWSERGVEGPSELVFPGPIWSSLAEDEVMRKKFLIFCETCEFEPLTDLLVDMDTPEKVRLSPVMTGYGGRGLARWNRG